MKQKLLLLIGVLLFSCHTPVYASGIDFDRIDQESKERIANSTVVTEGEFYNYLNDLCPGAVITDYHDGSVEINLSDVELNNNRTDATNFFWLSSRILGTQKFSSDYTDISFSYFKNNTSVILMTTSYISADNFTSCFTCYGSDSTAEFKDLYNKVFYNFDIDTKSARGNDEIAKKYNIPSTSVIEDRANYYWWVFSSFDPDVLFSIDDNTAAINFKTNFTDSYDDGYYVADTLLDSVSHYSTITASLPGGLSFNTIVIICFENDSENRLFEFRTNFQADHTWKTDVANYYGEEFKKGAYAAND